MPLGFESLVGARKVSTRRRSQCCISYVLLTIAWADGKFDRRLCDNMIANSPSSAGLAADGAWPQIEPQRLGSFKRSQARRLHDNLAY